MTFDLRNFKVGDRVSAVNKSNGDKAEFTVVGGFVTWLDSETNTFMDEHWTFDLIEPAKPALPTVAGLYRLTPGKYGSRHLVLTTANIWYWFDFTSSHKNEDEDYIYQGEHIKKKALKQYAGDIVLLWTYAS